MCIRMCKQICIKQYNRRRKRMLKTDRYKTVEKEEKKRKRRESKSDGL